MHFFTENVQEAKEKQHLLKSRSRRKNYIYTEDSDYTVEEKAKIIEKKFRQNPMSSLQNVMNVIPINSSSNESSTIDTSDQQNNSKKNRIKK